jgi:exosortase
MRCSLFLAIGGLIVYRYGFRQILHWWLPTLLLGLSIPLPSVVLGTLALPLQLQASRFGAAMLEWRHVPVMLSGNVIHLPSRSLFVTEACSGLRSLTSLLALGILMGGLWLKSPWLRVFLVAVAIPVAILLNGLRIFLTGFLVYYISPKLGDGLMHYTEGWAMFAVAFVLVGLLCWALSAMESLRRASRA